METFVRAGNLGDSIPSQYWLQLKRKADAPPTGKVNPKGATESTSKTTRAAVQSDLV